MEEYVFEEDTLNMHDPMKVERHRTYVDITWP
jgi:hypothetical protein